MIFAVNVILSGACQENTEIPQIIIGIPSLEILVVPDRIVSCPQDQRKNNHEKCRQVV